MSVREPLGVAGIITPWNFPMAIPCWKMMPALVTGNTVVLKPSSDTPHCATLLVELMAEAGFPPGTVNLLTGAGSEVGDALVANPDVQHHQLHRQHGDRQAHRRDRGPSAQAASASSSAARTRSWSWPTPTSTSPSTGSSGRRSGRPASAARPARGSSSRRPSPVRCSSASSRGRGRSASGSGLDPATDVGPLVNGAALDKVAVVHRCRQARRRTWSPAAIGRAARASNTATSSPRRSSAGSSRWTGSPRRRSSGRSCRSSRCRTTRRRSRRSISRATGCRRRSSPATSNTAFRAMRDFETGIVYVNAGHDRRRDPSPVRWHEADRQRPSRGRPRRARDLHRVEVDLRRLQRPPPAGPDRQPARLTLRASRRPRYACPCTRSHPRIA